MKLTTPIAIIIAGVLVAITIVFTTNQPQPANQVAQSDQENKLEKLLPIDKTDHVRGSKNPKVTIVEYSDYECPFCKRFHDTMKAVIEKYGDDVAWVYRHWPIESLHPRKARTEALAAECAADQKGSEGFWQFSDRFLELTPSNNQTDLDVVLSQIANEMKLDVDEFSSCIETEKFAKKVDRDAKNARATGGRGTPWSVVILPDGNMIPLNGAQPFEAVSALIEQALQQS